MRTAYFTIEPNKTLTHYGTKIKAGNLIKVVAKDPAAEMKKLFSNNYLFEYPESQPQRIPDFFELFDGVYSLNSKDWIDPKQLTLEL